MFKRRETALKTKDAELQESLIRFSKFLQVGGSATHRTRLPTPYPLCKPYKRQRVAYGWRPSRPPVGSFRRLSGITLPLTQLHPPTRHRQENDLKRAKAEKKASEEIAIRAQKEQELEQLEKIFDECRQLTLKEAESVEKSQKFQTFLEKVLESAQGFTEINDVITRFAALEATNRDLNSHSTQVAEGTDSVRRAAPRRLPRSRSPSAGSRACVRRRAVYAERGVDGPSRGTDGRAVVLSRAELQQYVKQASDDIMFLNNRISALKKDLETRRGFRVVAGIDGSDRATFCGGGTGVGRRALTRFPQCREKDVIALSGTVDSTLQLMCQKTLEHGQARGPDETATTIVSLRPLNVALPTHSASEGERPSRRARDLLDFLFARCRCAVRLTTSITSVASAATSAGRRTRTLWISFA